MKTRAGAQKANDETLVSTAIAKRDWFLKGSDLAALPRVKGVGLSTKYSTKDLDRLALRIHGVVGLAKKRAARAKRLEKTKTKKNAKDGRKRRWEDHGNVDVEEVVEEGKMPRWNEIDEVEVEDSYFSG